MFEAFINFQLISIEYCIIKYCMLANWEVTCKGMHIYITLKMVTLRKPWLTIQYLHITVVFYTSNMKIEQV